MMLLLGGSGGSGTPDLVAFPPTLPSNTQTQTGVHFARPGEFGTLKQLGMEFAVVDFPPDQPIAWRDALERASAAGIKLIVGLYPPPYQLTRNGTWKITASGVEFLNILKAHPDSVMAVFVYNEPYYTDPNPGGGLHDCGFYSADDLRKLRATIRTVWAEARIYHDLGDPSAWAPGSEFWQAHQSCIRDKYRDQTEVADYLGIWEYPFQDGKGYRKESSLRMLKRELDFVNASMQPARPVVLIQGFASRSLGFYFPTKAEMQDWNCSVRQLGPAFISWYPWRQPGRYDDFLVNHPNYWRLMGEDACRA